MSNIRKANGCIDLERWQRSEYYSDKEYQGYTRKVISHGEHEKNRKG